MPDWRLLARRLALADDTIESQDARILKDEIVNKGKIEKDEFEFLIALRRDAKSVTAEYDDIVFRVLKQVLVKSGPITPQRTTWLRSFLAPKGTVTKRELEFLKDLRGATGDSSREFRDWCSSLGVSAADAKPQKADASAYSIPALIPIEDVQPLKKRRMKTRKSGRAGYASLALSFMAYLAFFLIVVVFTATPGAAGQRHALNASLTAAIVGILLGGIGLFQNGDGNRVCALVGLAFNALALVGYGIVVSGLLAFAG